MRRPPRQGRLRQAGQIAGRAGHHGVRLIGTAGLVLLLLFGAASWRLARGPVDLPPLAARIAAATARALPGSTVTVGRAALAWEGFHRGGAPLDLRLSDIVVSGPNRAAALKISRLRVTLAPLALLRGRIAPIRIVAHRTAITLRPDRAGASPSRLLDDLLATITLRPGAHGIDFTDLRAVRISGALLALDDATLHLEFMARDSRFDLSRAADGAITGAGHAVLRHGAAAARLAVDVRATQGSGRIKAALGPGDPASLAPRNPALARFDLPITLTARWPLGAARTGLDVSADAGAGTVALGQSKIPVAHAGLAATIDRHAIDLTHGQIALGPRAGSAPVIGFDGRIGLSPPFAGVLHATVNRVSAAALPAYWPQALARGARRYVLRHISAGIAADGAFTAHLSLGKPPYLMGFSGGFVASGVSLDWFKGAPPMTALAGRLSFPDADTLIIGATSGALGGLSLRGGMRITGLTHHEQIAHLEAMLGGTVTAARPLLDAPPLRLATHGVALKGATGQVAGTIEAILPLDKKLRLAKVDLDAAAQLTSLNLPLPVHGLALEHGAIALTASLHRLALHGSGRLAGQAANFTASMTLPSGGFDLKASTLAGRALLASFGAAPSFWRYGAAPLTIAYDNDGGHGTLDLNADLTPVVLALPVLGWSKAAGQAGHAAIGLRLARGSPADLDTVDIAAPGLALKGRRQGDAMAIDAARIGDTRATGKLTPPDGPGRPWTLALAGPMLDLAAVLRHARASATALPRQTPAAASAIGPSWRLRAAFDALRLQTAPAPPLGPTHIIASGRAGLLGGLTATALVGAAHHADLRVSHDGAATRVALISGNAGALLASLGTTTDIAHGRLDLTASNAAGTTSGRVVLTDFRLRHAPVMAKVLQGVSLYGVPAATSGPGLAFTRLTAPFSVTGPIVTVRNGRAFSASLGFTAAGSIDLAQQRYDLAGTIVPAYALNTLPGRIPILGKLFSPEKGSGLFAARYTVDGPFTAPRIMVDPLAALAPGLLRDIFGVGPPDQPP